MRSSAVVYNEAAVDRLRPGICSDRARAWTCAGGSRLREVDGHRAGRAGQVELGGEAAAFVGDCDVVGGRKPQASLRGGIGQRIAERLPIRPGQLDTRDIARLGVDVVEDVVRENALRSRAARIVACKEADRIGARIFAGVADDLVINAGAGDFPADQVLRAIADNRIADDVDGARARTGGAETV